MSISQPSLGAPWARRAGAIALSRETAVVVALIVVIAATTASNPHFLFGADGVRDLLLTPALLVLLAVGQAVVLITRNIDLSSGSVLGLGAWLSASTLANQPGTPPVLVALTAILLGALAGAVNGFFVAVLGAPALVVTLGALYAFRGINVLWADGKVIGAAKMPGDFLRFGVGGFLSLPNLSVIAVLLVVIVAWYMYKRPSARELYAIGSDPQAATLLGLRGKRRVFLVFVASGAIAGLAGFMYAARYGAVDSQAGTGLELSAVAAAVLGGVAIFGGSGTVWGAAIGAVLLITINRALPIMGVPDFWQQAVVGLLIIGAIVLDRLLALRRRRRLSAIRENEHD